MAKNDEKTLDDKAAADAAKKAAADEAKAAADADGTDGLVKMHKDGEHLHVHPTTVDAHKAAGWTHA